MSVFWQVLLALFVFFVVLPVLGSALLALLTLPDAGPSQRDDERRAEDERRRGEALEREARAKAERENEFAAKWFSRGRWLRQTIRGLVHPGSRPVHSASFNLPDGVELLLSIGVLVAVLVGAAYALGAMFD